MLTIDGLGTEREGKLDLYESLGDKGEMKDTAGPQNDARVRIFRRINYPDPRASHASVGSTRNIT